MEEIKGAKQGYQRAHKSAPHWSPVLPPWWYLLL